MDDTTIFLSGVLRQLLSSESLDCEVSISEIYHQQGWKLCRSYGICHERHLENYLNVYSEIFHLQSDDGSTYVSPQTSLTLCATHSSKSGSCRELSCDALHFCKFYLLSGRCKFGQRCLYSHGLRTPHNRRLLEQHYLDGLTLTELRRLFCLPWVRQGVTVPKVCRYYNVHRGCTRGPACLALHLCKPYVLGHCKFARNCKRNHDINHRQVTEVLTQYGVTVTGRPLTRILQEVRNFVKDHSDNDYDSGSEGYDPGNEGYDSDNEDYDSGSEDDDDLDYSYGTSAPRGRQSLADRSANGPRPRSLSKGRPAHAQSAGRAVESPVPRDTLMHHNHLRAPGYGKAGSRSVARQDETERKSLHEHPGIKQANASPRSLFSAPSFPRSGTEVSQHAADHGASARDARPGSRLESVAEHDTAMSLLNRAPTLDPASLLSARTAGRNDLSSRPASSTPSAYRDPDRSASLQECAALAYGNLRRDGRNQTGFQAEALSRDQAVRNHQTPAAYLDQQRSMRKELYQVDARSEVERERQARREAEERSQAYREELEMTKRLLSQLNLSAADSTTPLQSFFSVENPSEESLYTAYSRLSSAPYSSPDPESSSLTSLPFRHLDSPPHPERQCAPVNPSVESSGFNSSLFEFCL